MRRETVQVNHKRPRETQPRKAHDAGKCGRRTRTRTSYASMTSNEKVDEKEAVGKYGITPVDTKWVDRDKAFEGEPVQIRLRMCERVQKR